MLRLGWWIGYVQVHNELLQHTGADGGVGVRRSRRRRRGSCVHGRQRGMARSHSEALGASIPGGSRGREAGAQLGGFRVVEVFGKEPLNFLHAAGGKVVKWRGRRLGGRCVERGGVR